MKEGKPSAKIVRLLRRGQITIPAEFRERLNIKPDTLLCLQLKGGKIEITRLRVVSEGEALRDYSPRDIQRFLAEDELDEKTAAKVHHLLG